MKTSTKLFLGVGALSVVGLGVLAWAKTSSSVNFVKNLTFEPLWYGGINDMDISSSGIKLPLAVDLGNRSDQTFRVRINAVDIYKGGKKIAYSTARYSEVVLNPYSPSRLKLDIVVGWSFLFTIGVTMANAIGNLNKVMEAFAGMSMRIDFTINDAVQTPITVDFENGAVKMDGLGLVPTYYHKVGNIRDYVGFIPSSTYLKKKDKLIINDVSPEETARFVRRKASACRWQTESLARKLAKSSPYETVRSVYDFVDKYIAYVADPVNEETVREPLRCLYDQKGDCDCMTMLICSLFENLGIKYTIRIAEYDHKGYFQHIYAIAHIGGGRVPCDPVVGQFDYEKPFTNYKDF